VLTLELYASSVNSVNSMTNDAGPVTDGLAWGRQRQGTGLLGLALGEGAAWRLPPRVASSSCQRRRSFSASRSRRRRQRAWQPAQEAGCIPHYR
jgi:hypothetical protein